MESAGSRYLLRLPASGGTERTAVPESGVTPELLAALLGTDVTERYRLPEAPDAFAGKSALCYFIDARGGEKALPVNFAGTCFYHTGCPIHGDLLLAVCSEDCGEKEVSGLTAAECDLLTAWLNAQFPVF
ncbi:MAG: hypothetical protein J6Z45_05395 [Oscillospiraceae bacterium]|nr:hypothetical protein [Oscillospiraceae bacterium]